MKEKTNTGLVILIILLFVVVICLSLYILWDKSVISNDISYENNQGNVNAAENNQGNNNATENNQGNNNAAENNQENNNAIESAIKELVSISESLQNQIISSFDGKTFSGAEAIAMAQMYQNSSNISIIIIEKDGKRLHLGAYNYDILDKTISKLSGPQKGGIDAEFMGKLQNANSIEDVESNVFKAGIYYSYLMRDSKTQDIVGVALISKSALK